MNQPIASESALSAFLRNLPDTLRQPFSLALVGSVGAHLFFFLWLPLFTSEEAKPEAQRVVRLLSSPPQPQVTTSQLGLPPIPKTPNSTVEIPLRQDLNRLIPPDSSLYKFQDPILPYNPIVPPAPPAIRFPQPTTLFQPSQIPQNFNRVPDLPDLTLRSVPAQSSPTQSPNKTPSPPLNGQTDENIAKLTPGFLDNPSTPASPQPTDPATQPNQPGATTATVRPGEQLLSDNRRLRDKITFKSPGATPNEIASNNIASYGDWFKKNVTDRGIPEGSLGNQQILVADVPYKSRFDLSEKYEPAYINVLVAPDGTVLTPQLAITGPTGYGILDDLATKEVLQLVTIAQKEGTLKPSGNNKDKYVIYKYKVTFKIERTA